MFKIEFMIKKTRSDGDATRARLLETAGRLIAAQGFAQTTNKAIAREAGVDLASINYHFGGRKGLYQAVIAEGHRRFIDFDVLDALVKSDIDPRVKIATVFEQVIENLMEETSWQARIFLQELISPSRYVEKAVQAVILPKILLIRKIVHQITQIPEDDPAILRCQLSIMAPCAVFLVGSGLPNPVFKALEINDRKKFIRHHLEFCFAGLEAVAKTFHQSA